VTLMLVKGKPDEVEGGKKVFYTSINDRLCYTANADANGQQLTYMS
jgi:hypothetical protein